MAKRLIPDHFLFSKNTLHEVKAIGQHLSFKIFASSQLGHTIKINCIKLNDFLEKGLGLDSPPHFVHDILLLYSIHAVIFY